MAANPLHSDQTKDDGIHIIYAFEYADATARTGATGLVAEDIGKVARQLDDTTFWVLVNHVGPIWDHAAGGPVVLPTYLVGGLPSVTPAGRMIYVSDESGGAVPAFSDGANWLRVTDRAVVT